MRAGRFAARKDVAIEGICHVEDQHFRLSATVRGNSATERDNVHQRLVIPSTIGAARVSSGQLNV